MATERAFSLFGPLPGLWSRNGHQLGQQFHSRSNVFAYDALPEPYVDVCHIRHDLRPRLDRDLVHVSGNERVEVGRCEGAFKGWMV